MAWAKASPITAKSTSCSSVALTLAPTSSTTVWPRKVGQIDGDGGTRNAFDDAQPEHGHRHQRAGIAGADRDIGFAVLHALDGAPHGGVLAPAQHMAGLVLHASPGPAHGAR